jgi:uncharacterized protein
MELPLRPAGQGCELRLRVTSRGGRDAVVGLVLDATGAVRLAVKVATAAEGGKANAAVLRLVARSLAIAPSAVELKTGAGARQKTLHLALDAATAEARLRAVLDASGEDREDR